MWQRRKVLQGSASNLARVILTMALALVLPPLLVHRLAPSEYAAWVLILQCSGYISLLDFGMQTAIGKFVAEYDAAHDRMAASKILSSSVAILCVSAMAGVLLILGITWQVPHLFHQMPGPLMGAMRMGILAVGLSTVCALPFNAFLGAFTGLQRYGFPTALAMLSKFLQSAALAIMLLMRGGLIQLVWILAFFNIATGLSQYAGWKRYASDRLDFAWRLANRPTAVRLARYGGILSIWTIAGLFISGLDLVIVGHYDYGNTGYYGIATSVTNFMLLVIGGLFSPLLPAVSSLQAGQSYQEVGEVTVNSTRYCALLLALCGIPLAFGAYPLLSFWVGHQYAVRSITFLQILILGNVIRQLGYPYSVAVIATGKQHLATIAAVSEAIINLLVSVILVKRIGAAGVAIGTVVGALVGVLLHLTVSMRYTQGAIPLSRRRFAAQGLLRPLLCVFPSLLLIHLWNRYSMLPWKLPWLLIWVVCTLFLGWKLALTRHDRERLESGITRLVRVSAARPA